MANVHVAAAEGCQAARDALRMGRTMEQAQVALGCAYAATLAG